MSDNQAFIIMGIPKAQARPRFARVGKFVRTYDPKESVQHKANIAAQIVAQHPRLIGAGRPIELYVVFTLPRPKGHFGKKGLKPSSPPCHTTKPDLDNMLKALKDACKGILWADDSQVVSVKAAKEYGIDEAKTEMAIKVLL